MTHDFYKLPGNTKSKAAQKSGIEKVTWLDLGLGLVDFRSRMNKSLASMIWSGMSY